MAGKDKSIRASIIIPNWNGGEFLPACLNSLKKQTLTDFEVIVVDNGSEDGSAEIEQSELTLRVIKLGRNTGFSFAVNRGIEAARSDYTVLLNNDTETDPKWLAELVAGLDDNPDYDFGAAKMLHFDDRDLINTSGDGMSVYGVPYGVGSNSPDGLDYAKPRPLFGASGGAVIYRKSLFEDIGLFDERFFLYMEDLDICFRAQLRNHRCLSIPAARVYHHVGGTSGRISGWGQFYTSRNMLFVLIKNWPTELWRRYWHRLLLGQLAWLFSDHNPRRFLANLKAYVSFVVNLPPIWRERRRIQDRRTASIEYIDSLLAPCYPADSAVMKALKKLRLVRC